jgi:hypothetical protein
LPGPTRSSLGAPLAVAEVHVRRRDLGAGVGTIGCIAATEITALLLWLLQS